jgi:hypothetical protein
VLAAGCSPLTFPTGRDFLFPPTLSRSLTDRSPREKGRCCEWLHSVAIASRRCLRVPQNPSRRFHVSVLLAQPPSCPHERRRRAFARKFSAARNPSPPVGRPDLLIRGPWRKVCTLVYHLHPLSKTRAVADAVPEGFDSSIPALHPWGEGHVRELRAAIPSPVRPSRKTSRIEN